MKRLAILIVVALAFLSLPVYGNQVGVSWTQQYRLWGFELYDDNYVHPGAEIDLWGVNASVTEHLQNLQDDWDNLDARISYKLPVGDLYVRPAYAYLMLPAMDVQEASLTVGVSGRLSPRYTLEWVMPEQGENGQVHTLGLDIDIGEVAQNVRALASAEIVYNDGVNPLVGETVTAWTHATAGLQLQIPLGNLTFQPGVVYQHAFEPELLQCKEDEVWATVSLMSRF
jgi:hypothetical protein